ncbi:MAG: SMI1/KNR4 family protein [Cyanobacteria bacterium P01_F01_bin.86]
MSNFDWERFLRQWSEDLISTVTKSHGQLPPEVHQSGWWGYPGATEAQIQAAEVRLGITLPPSYREFFKVTNGWRQTTPFINHICSLEEIEWFADTYPEWVNAFSSPHDANVLNFSDHETSQNGAIAFSVSNEEYFIYGAEQDCSKFRLEYLPTALAISEKGDDVIYLLNPQVINDQGEWEAWFLGDWLPGADRYRSFSEMMQAEYANFLELREYPSQPILPEETA